MAKFTDADGRDWTVRIRLGDLWAFKEEAGSDFFILAQVGQLSPTEMLTLGYLAVKEQAEKRGIQNCRDWLNSIGKDKVESLLNAVGAELEEFFPEAKKEGAAGSDPPSPAPGNGETSGD